MPNVPLLIPAAVARTRPPPTLDDDEELELSPDFASSGRSRSSAIISSRLIELLTSLLLIALLTADVPPPPPPAVESSLLLPFDASRVADADDTTAEGDSVDEAPIPVVVVEGVELVVEVALPSVEDCCLRLRYSVMESLRFGVIGALAGLAAVATVASVPDDAATSAGLSRGSELAVLVNIFG